MTALELLSKLSRKDIDIWADGDRLHYDAPKGALTPDLRKELVARKSEILALLRQTDTVTSSASFPLKRVSRAGDLPLSFAQERFWVLDQFHANRTVLNCPDGFRLRGPFQLEVFRESVQALVDRHEILRTTFPSVDGEPYQAIALSLSVEVPLQNCSGLSKEEQAEMIQRAFREEGRFQFDLARGPLFRARLLRFAENDHFLVLNRHHIIHDAWSLEIIIKDLVTAYTAGCAGHAVTLPTLPIQYVDYAHWQRELLEEPVGRKQLAFWKTQLAQLPPALPLPTDYVRPAVQTFRGAFESLQLSAELLASLRALNRQEGTTLFMVLLATLQLLFHRLTGTHDILVGSLTAGRDQQELHDLIGCFLNTLVLRTDLSGDITGRDLLQRVREVVLNAYENRDVPFEKLLAEVDVARDLSRTPIFQVLLNMHSFDDRDFPLPDLSVTRVGLTDIDSPFDMTLYFYESPNEIKLSLVYNTDLFEASTISWMLSHFETLLEGIVDDPDQCISALPLLTGATRQQLSSKGNTIQPTTSFARIKAAEIDQSLHGRFMQQVRSYPDNMAVKTRKYAWTYAQLNLEANRIAQRVLSACGDKAPRIALLFGHDAPMIASLLGALKAGKTYVPLDPSYPVERLAYILEDSNASAVLTDSLNADLAHALTREKVPLINIDAPQSAPPLENVDVSIPPDALAYILYTSGSTGRPKGVMQNHRNVMHFIRVYTNNLHISEDDRLTLISSYSFDGAIMDIFGALLNGATLYPVNIKEETAERILRWFNDQEITLYHSTPTVYRYLLSYLDPPQKLSKMRLVVLGGEEVFRRDVELYQKHFAPDCIFINGLGPSESTVTLQYFINGHSAIRRTAVPVGYPVDATEILLLNDAGEDAGVYGEIAIRSPHIALGYWQQPELTDKVFLPDPERGDRRIYRTGDMGRLLPDGSIEFVGRKDAQVKIRGIRIEVGEVEVVLGQHPAVGEVVVDPGEDAHGDRRLVAYLATSANPMPSIAEIRGFLQQKLPDYMIPSAFVFLDALPRTPNGKVDRRALPEPDAERPELQAAFVTPRSQSEELVAGIWRSVLGVERIGVYDNFFELGGHSLLAVQIISRIREVFELELPLRTLFEAPTVAGITGRIEAARRSDEGLQTFPLQTVSRNQDLPLSFAQERLWFLHHLEPASVAYSMPLRIRLKGVLSKDALEKTYVALARRHEILRTTFHLTDGNPVLRIADQPNIQFDTVDLRHLPQAERDAEARRLCEEDARQPFDLERGPLLRIRLIQLEDEAHVLHSNMHHIISDAWSSGVMAREIKALYTAFIKDKPAGLPDLPVQYADYAVWQRQWLQGEALEAQLSYWKDKLGGELPVLELPTDRPRPAVQTHRHAIESLALSKALSDALQALSRREGVTLFMTLLAAFKTLLYRHTGQEDLLVGTPLAGRNRTELEGLIGFFMNTIVMRTDLAGQPPFRELLGRVRETALGAYAHQDMPFEKLVEELAPERDLSRTPLFQVFVNHIVATDYKLADLPGIASEAVGGFDRESKFDMTLYVVERDGGIAFGYVYNTDLYDRWRMAEMLKQYEELLKQIVENPDTKISHYSLVTAEAHQVLPDPRALLTEPMQTSIMAMFADWVKRTPEQTALRKGDQTLTYEKLFERTQILASVLRLNGLDRGDVVAVCGPRSFGLIANMMAVFLSGGVLLPIDDSLPRQRRRLILQEAGAKFLLFIRGSGFEDAWWEQDSALRVQSLEVDTQGLVRGDTDFDLGAVSQPALGSDDAAYIFFTSGTTGVPKGVLGSHKGLNHFLNWQRETFDFTPQDRVAHLTSLSFDPVLREIFLPLTSGATLCLPEDIDILAANDVLSWLDGERISVLHTVPSLAQSWLTNSTVEVSLNAMRWVFFAGESLTQNLVDRWQTRFPSAEIVNLYGPAETTLAKCFYQLSSGIQHGVQPLGQPLPQTQALVLSRANQLCAIGEPGEIVLRTPFRSLGYINNHAENQTRFVKNPFCDQEQDQLYYTGDRGRYRPDGTLEFLGRLDDQVKIRGVRVEPNEVTGTLARHPAVGSCFVTSKRDERGEPRLVAYVVITDQNKTTVSELRAYLRKELPDYMIPSAFVFLDALPLTPRGKVDRRALPTPDVTRPDLQAAFVAPRSQSEELVAGIWRSVLGVERIGVYDNFFDLGGHSLLATRVVSRIQQEFLVDLKLMNFFKMPTIAEFTKSIEGLLWINAGKPCDDKAELHNRTEGVL